MTRDIVVIAQSIAFVVEGSLNKEHFVVTCPRWQLLISRDYVLVLFDFFCVYLSSFLLPCFAVQ